ncbi:MAG: hypothetical protein WCI18_09405 [Pseudomonadota bacterium]
MKNTFAKFQADLAKKITEVVQADLATLQTMVEKEAKVISAKVRKYAGESGLDKKAKEIEKKAKKLEKLAITEYKKIEPSIHKFVKELRDNAQRVGIDLDKIEKEIVHAAQSAKAKVTGKKPSRTTGKTAARAKTSAKAPAKKTPAKKASPARKARPKKTPV